MLTNTSTELAELVVSATLVCPLRSSTIATATSLASLLNWLLKAIKNCPNGWTRFQMSLALHLVECAVDRWTPIALADVITVFSRMDLQTTDQEWVWTVDSSQASTTKDHLTACPITSAAVRATELLKIRLVLTGGIRSFQSEMPLLLLRCLQIYYCSNFIKHRQSFLFLHVFQRFLV